MAARVLLVDDESVIQRVVTHTLKTLDIEVIGVMNGQDAYAFAQEQTIDLAIIDINLPDVDGFTLIEHLRTLPTMQEVPFIIFTARSHGDDAARAQELGAAGFIYKPFSTQELRSLVLSCLP